MPCMTDGYEKSDGSEELNKATAAACELFNMVALEYGYLPQKEFKDIDRRTKAFNAMLTDCALDASKETIDWIKNHLKTDKLRIEKLRESAKQKLTKEECEALGL